MYQPAAGLSRLRLCENSLSRGTSVDQRSPGRMSMKSGRRLKTSEDRVLAVKSAGCMASSFRLTGALPRASGRGLRITGCGAVSCTAGAWDVSCAFRRQGSKDTPRIRAA